MLYQGRWEAVGSVFAGTLYNHLESGFLLLEQPPLSSPTTGHPLTPASSHSVCPSRKESVTSSKLLCSNPGLAPLHVTRELQTGWVGQL